MTVGISHLLSFFVLSAAVAFIYSLNMQGWRAGEPLVRGTLRRFTKIVVLMGYLALTTQLLTWAGETHGAARTFHSGVALGLLGLLTALVFLHDWVMALWHRLTQRSSTQPPASS